MTTGIAHAEPTVPAQGERATLIAPSVGQAFEIAGVGADDPVLDDLEQRTFRYFWDTTNKKNGLAPDRFPTPSFVSIAAIGYALTAFVVGAERGYVKRSQASERVLNSLRFLANAPQGPEASGVAGHKGFYYHFLNPKD
ncbi:MAG TPA: hypothetical protein VMF89_34380, partial [Polyangiales bacterium]|nr:hypothetical protein [Polyangiales bacterium]